MKAGYVYVIKDVSVTGYHKIGRTNNPERRLREFTVKLPFETHLVMLIESENAAALEKSLHSLLNYTRIRGEWFDLGHDEIQYLKSMYEYTIAWKAMQSC